MAKAMDKELQQYRDLMPVPDRFEEGFGWKTVIGAMFMGFVMVPGNIYLSLFIGAGLGSAAQWVTVILFSEIVKRSMKTLRKQEIYILFYMTGMTLSMPINVLWSQYFVTSPAAVGMGVAAEIPTWWAPNAEALAQSGRTFLTVYWLQPIMLAIGLLLIGRIDNFGLGYALYRLTAHVEKLPFPMAPMGALGITALADTRDEGNRWRWRCFSIGGVIGMLFGLIYIGLPTVTETVFGKSVEIIPIPWLDLSTSLSTRESFPAMPFNLVFDVGLIILGMVLPFWAVIGGFIGLLVTLVANPMLYRSGYLTTWREGMTVVDTLYSNHIDFYLSFSIGLTLAIFVVSVWPIVKPLIGVFPGARKEVGGSRMTVSEFWTELRTRNRERGDLSIFTGVGIYFASTTLYIVTCVFLMPGTAENHYTDRFPWVFFLGFAFIYQPIISYTNAKLAGMVGQAVAIPLVREASFILSGYKGAAIWFAPIPINDYGAGATSFRTLELTGTKLGSVIKTEILVFPVMILSTIMFSELIWRLAPIPSEAYPFTQEVWHLNALNQSLTITSTLDGSSAFMEAIKPGIIGWGLGLGVLSFIVLSLLNLPTFLVYGVVRGLGQTSPGAVIPEVIGAFVGRYYLERRFGREKFKMYIMIIYAGYAAGVGLIGMAGVAFALIAKSTSTLGY
jgi:hypothetical protein